MHPDGPEKSPEGFRAGTDVGVSYRDPSCTRRACGRGRASQTLWLQEARCETAGGEERTALLGAGAGWLLRAASAAQESAMKSFLWLQQTRV